MNLRSNIIRLEGANALKEALQENYTLTTLYLQDNKISGIS